MKIKECTEAQIDTLRASMTDKQVMNKAEQLFIQEVNRINDEAAEQVESAFHKYLEECVSRKHAETSYQEACKKNSELTKKLSDIRADVKKKKHSGASVAFVFLSASIFFAVLANQDFKWLVDSAICLFGSSAIAYYSGWR